MRVILQDEMKATPTMNPDFDALQRALDAHAAAEPPDFARGLEIVEAMHAEARRRGQFGQCGLEDVGADIRLARVMNHVNRPA